jgi:hypothetical protein
MSLAPVRRSLLLSFVAAGALTESLSGQEPATQPVAAPPAIVQGRILGPDKKAIDDVEVVYGETRSVLTDRRGRFTFDPAPAGVHDVLARKIGYVPVRFRVAVTPGDVWDGTINMERTAQTLPEVVVLDSTALTNFRPRWLTGFLERRSAGMGTFLDRVDIENSRLTTTGRLVATSPGIIARSAMGWDELNVNRCGHGFGTSSTGIVYVDGFKTETSVTGRFVTLRDYPPERLWAVEIFKGRDTFPANFYDPNACLLVLLWTNRR